MSTYASLKKNDRLPLVAILQLLLNRQAKGMVDVDGVFGPKTEMAVRNFQAQHNLSYSGKVNRETWLKLIEGTGFRIIDCVDVTEEWMTEYDETGWVQSGKPEHTLDGFKAVGANPVEVGATTYGVRDAIRKVIDRAGNPGTLILLRFYGHGESGWQGISYGTGFHNYDDETSALWYKTLKSMEKNIRRLNSHLGIYTSIQLHGCQVAKWKRGERFVQRLADIWGVPVSAAKKDQYGSNAIDTFEFEGPVFNAFPKGKNLKTWSKGLPILPEVVVSSKYKRK